jgi:urease accessory protein UreF
MATQELERLHDTLARRLSKARRGMGFALRRQMQDVETSAWHETITKHVPEPWPAARLALQARIAALDVS